MIPGVFNAAGLIVPEPSIMLPPRPFIEVVTTGWVAEYMTGDVDGPWPRLRPRQSSHPPRVLKRKSACGRQSVERVG